ncbi:MAG TPA: two-component regulator propeller domain-containing protein [Hanamia sp.]|nr:two-component regulator propeller domain-containing protein [Hanamia sp.]
MLSVRGTIRIFLTGLLVFVAGTENLFAQQLHNLSRLFFDQITTQNGLSGNEITCLYHDKRGFLWIGTHNGLNEYDGRDVKVFQHSRFDSHSIIDNYIISIAEDDSGYLWLGTNEGICRFNPYDHQSMNYSHQLQNPFSLNDNQNCHVYIDKEGTVWIGNESGLSYFNKKSKHFIPVQILPDSLNKQRLSSVGRFLEDSKGRLWLGTFSGLVLFNRKQHTFKRFTLNPETKPGANAITTLFEDHQGRIWVGIWGSGLIEFDPVTCLFYPYKWNHKNTFKSTVNLVFSLGETRTGNGHYTLWAGTSEGLLKIDSFPVNDRSVTHILPDHSDLHSLSDNQIRCMITDNENILWIGTDNGLDEYVPGDQLFSDITYLKGNISKILVDTSEKPVHYFVAAWYGNGLTELDDHFHILHEWKQVPPNSNNVNNVQISDVLRSKNGLLWIGTFNGLYSYDEKRNIFNGYLHKDGKDSSPASNKIISLMEDDSGLLWIGTYGHGMDVYDPVKKTFTHYHHSKVNPYSICNDLVWGIYKDKFNQVWVGTDKGLSLFNRKQNQFINYTDHQNDSQSLKGNIVSGIIAGDDSTFWIATNKGLNRLNTRNGLFTLYAQEEGLANNNITALVKDTNGRLWMCTGSGISSFDPVKKTFINYDEQNGLQGGDFAGVMAKDKDGNILVGRKGSLLRFNPAEFQSSSSTSPTYITEVRVGGRKVVFHRPVEESGALILHYPLNNFSATFDAPQFFNGKATKYAYRLDGVDAKWIFAANRNFVSYSNLTAGNYTLHVKAANSQGVWNKADTQLHITVLPPFWKTWWFRLAVVLMVALLIYSVFTYRVTSIRKQEALKTTVNKQMADMRLKTLRSRMNPHFMFNALNSIQECIYTGQTNAAYKYLSKFSHLVRMILERSEQTFITVSQETEMLKLYLELESLRFQQSFNYSIRQDGIEADFLKIPPMLIQPFVENAIWHGLLHKEGEKKLLITFRADDNFVKVIIEDNGIGRDAARNLKMKTLEEQHSLGMRLVSEQLETVGKMSNKVAEIRVEDLLSADAVTGKQMPSGTRVTLFIPIINGNT